MKIGNNEAVCNRCSIRIILISLTASVHFVYRQQNYKLWSIIFKENTPIRKHKHTLSFDGMRLLGAKAERASSCIIDIRNSISQTLGTGVILSWIFIHWIPIVSEDAALSSLAEKVPRKLNSAWRGKFSSEIPGTRHEHRQYVIGWTYTL